MQYSIKIFYVLLTVHLGTIDSVDDEHRFARNTYKSEINTLKKVRQVGY